MAEITEMIVSAVGELSLFRSLTADQIVSLLSVCQNREYKVGDVVCDAGTDSTEVFLLVFGEFSVSIESGIPVATLTPVTTVGEMGIITEQPRIATVQAAKESEAFVINKRQFEHLVQEDENMGIKVYRNIGHSLCDKIVRDNIRTRDYYAAKSAYERRIGDHRNQIEILKSLLMDRGVEEEEIEEELAKHSE